MNTLEQAVRSITHFLEARRIPYMLIGGVANLVWGEPRSTLDVDVSVLVEEEGWMYLIKDVAQVFRVIPENPLQFIRETHVLPIETETGVRIDLLWAQLAYEHKAIARASLQEVAGHSVRVCQPEDLIIHKIVSERPKDREDVRGIVRFQGLRLDRAYLNRVVRELSRALDRPELMAFLNRCFREVSRKARL